MRVFRVTYVLSAPSLTPWHADTLFGHLCWGLLRLHGSDAVRSFLQRYREGDPPLVLSDGFAPETFPRPTLPAGLPHGRDQSIAVRISAARRGKAARARRWLSAAEFARVRNGEPATDSQPLKDI